MMSRRECVAASLLLAFFGWCVHAHLKGREAMKRKIAMDEVEEGFYVAVNDLQKIHRKGIQYYEESTQWSRKPFMESAQKPGKSSSSVMLTTSRRKSAGTDGPGL